MAVIKDRTKGLVIKEEVPAYSAEALQELALEDSNKTKEMLSPQLDTQEYKYNRIWEVAKETIIRSNQMRAMFNTLFKIASPI